MIANALQAAWSLLGEIVSAAVSGLQGMVDVPGVFSDIWSYPFFEKVRVEFIASLVVTLLLHAATGF